MSNKHTQPLPGKPITLRVIFILNALMSILPFIFYFVVTSQNIELGGIDPQWLLYTGVAYALSFIAMIRFILKRNYVGIRAVIFINLLIALPTKAYLGMVVAVISFALTFEKRVKAYFLVA